MPVPVLCLTAFTPPVRTLVRIWGLYVRVLGINKRICLDFPNGINPRCESKRMSKRQCFFLAVHFYSLNCNRYHASRAVLFIANIIDQYEILFGASIYPWMSFRRFD
jgi:hypothetical protein